MSAEHTISTTSGSTSAVRGRPGSAALEDRQTRARRIAYFMLFRLAILAGFTVVAGVVFYARGDSYGREYLFFAWGTLVTGYALTIWWARGLPLARNLERFAAVQTAVDIVLTAVVVQMTGGVDSGFVTLYLIAVLGAATMGGRRMTWIAAAACAAIYLAMASLELAQVPLPFAARSWGPLPAAEHWSNVARTLVGLVGVTVLSSYLNAQLRTSASQLDTLRALNENIVRSLNSGLITVDSHRRLLYANPTANGILGLDESDIGRSLEELLPGVDLDGAMSDGRQELLVAAPHEPSLRIGLSNSPLTDAAGVQLGHVINFQDLTHLHELTQRVRRNERLAALGGLAASVAHEIRNPLAAISGSAELLGSANLAGDDAKLLSIISRESTRLSNLITDLLAFTRPRAPQSRPSAIRQTTMDACEAFRADPAAAEIELELHIPEPGARPLLVDLDPTQLSQVLWNLLRNAAQAMSGVGRIDATVSGDESTVNVAIADNGPGIPPEDLERIFDPFFTTKESGTGFGLAIVHRMVEENGGTVSCVSVPGEGATFILQFDRYVPTIGPSDSGVLDL